MPDPASSSSSSSSSSSASFSASLTALRSAQKPPRGVPAYTRFVNRPIGRAIAAAAHVVGATPNAVSVASAAISGIGILLLAVVAPSPLLGVAVAVLLLLGYAFDSADGQLARLSGTGSSRGEWLDHVLDCAKILLLHAAVLVSFYRFPADRPDSDAVLLVPLAFQFAAVMTFFVTTLSEQLRRGRGPRTSSAGAASVQRSLLMLPIDFGTVALSFVLLGTSVFVPAYAVLALAALLFMAAFAARGWRELAPSAAAPLPAPAPTVGEAAR